MLEMRLVSEKLSAKIFFPSYTWFSCNFNCIGFLYIKTLKFSWSKVVSSVFCDITSPSLFDRARTFPITINLKVNFFFACLICYVIGGV